MDYIGLINHPRASSLVLKKSSSMLATFKAPLWLGCVPSDNDWSPGSQETSEQERDENPAHDSYVTIKISFVSME